MNARMPDYGCRIPDSGCRMPDSGAGCRVPDGIRRGPATGNGNVKGGSARLTFQMQMKLKVGQITRRAIFSL